MENLSHEDQICVGVAVAALAAVALNLAQENLNRKPHHNSALSGDMYTQELIDSANPHKMAEVLGVDRKVFLLLLEVLIKTTAFSDSTYVRAEEQVAIFLYYGRTNAPLWVVADRFNRSLETIERCE
jgi:hypothetical protein